MIFHCLNLPLFSLNQELAGGHGIAVGIAGDIERHVEEAVTLAFCCENIHGL